MIAVTFACRLDWANYSLFPIRKICASAFVKFFMFARPSCEISRGICEELRSALMARDPTR
jgi:hypothetical protein